MSTALVTPKQALAIGGALYGMGVVWMFRNYIDRSSIRKLYVKADKEYERVHVMGYPQYEGNRSE